MFRVFITLLTFVLGVAATLLWLKFRHPSVRKSEAQPCSHSLSNESASPNLPILAYCELANNPEKYNGQVVRVSARLGGSIYGILFYDQNCPGPDMGAAVTFEPQNEEEIERSLKQASGSNSLFEPVNLIAVGRFKEVVPFNGSDTIYDTAPLQFEIIRIEKASIPR
jgi:hypothetical protein